MEENDDTAIVPERRKDGGKTAMVLSFIVGLVAAIGPGYYSLKQAKIEASVAREKSRNEDRIGYETLANPLEQFRSAIKILDWRVQRLENQSNSSLSMPPITPEPLVQPALKTPVPQTLTEANAPSITDSGSRK